MEAGGDYTATDGSFPVYTVTLSTELDVIKTEDGTYHYTLRLPDVANMNTSDGVSVSNDDFGITTSAELKTNVSENLTDQEEPETDSEAYVESDATTIEWTK